MASINEKNKCIVFDVEGVVLPKRRYLFFEVGRHLGLRNIIRIAFYGVLYELGLISLESALKKLFRAFRGLTIQQLLQVFKQVPLMAGTEEVFSKLKKEGWTTVLISSGLPTFIVEDLKEKLKADYAFGFNVKTEKNVLTGEIYGSVIEHEGKKQALLSVVNTYEMNKDNYVVVADDRNNASIFCLEALKIGFNPDFLIRIKADYVIRGELRDILSIIDGKTPREETSITRNEVVREMIHASGFLIPFLAGFLGTYLISLGIAAVTVFYIVSEVTRMEGKRLPVVSSITRHAASQSELLEFTTAPIFYAFGIMATLLIFPSPISTVAIVMFSFGDSTASLFGQLLGRTKLPYNKGKTLEGTLIGFAFALLAGSLMINPFKALLGAAAAMIIESLPLPINDNILVPILTGLIIAMMSI